MAPKKAYRPIAPKRKVDKNKSLLPLFCFSLILWIIVAVISIYIAVGCLYNNSLYIVQVHSNATIPVQVQIGYFGTCVSTNTNANDPQSNTTKTACIKHLDYDDDETLTAQFMEELAEENKNTTVPAISEPLDKLLPIAERLRSGIFPAAVPISFLIMYLLSIISFWILLSSPAASKTYKTVFALTALLNAYGLTLGLIVATTTRQACRGLIFPAEGDTGILEPGIFITEDGNLQQLQWVVSGVSIGLQLCIAGLFVQRQAYGSNATLRPSMNIKSYKLCC
ncbi:hypothetical protein F5Y10DRAFT_289121 [Nemania abortiva]|nr:hypothetical protein F5Y10DRAFT_289121 [Nemania abortiva]